MSADILYTNIQRFSLHDGPGIRTTVFLKGCTLHCPWCANPENLKAVPEPYRKAGKEGIYGRWISTEDLYDQVMKDRLFYDQISGVSSAYAGMPGGVTFSGGEPLLQMGVLEPLLRKLKEKDIHLCVETALFVPVSYLECALRYIDLFYVDLKILDAALCGEILGGDFPQYRNNTAVLFASGKPVIYRIPVIGGFTDGEENRQAVVGWLERFRPAKVELIKEHNLGRSKYLCLGKEPPVLNTVTDEEMQRYQREIVQKTGLETEICSI